LPEPEGGIAGRARDEAGHHGQARDCCDVLAFLAFHTVSLRHLKA
jgi:hypothetical protein